jgi:hypothetical protein
MPLRGALALALALVPACKSKEPPPAPPPPSTQRDAAVPADSAVPADPVAACEATLRGAMKVPANRRVTSILAGCAPCGDWTPLLLWETPAAEGGPSRTAIDEAMQRCDAYCTPDAKQRFLGTLDAARGKGTRTPWRLLGEICKEQMSAAPDARHASAPLLALDRIARWIATRKDASVLAPIELAMPAVTITGAGFELPHAPVTAPEPGRIALTVTKAELRLAEVPRGKLDATGVVIATRTGEPYPGVRVRSGKELETQLAELGEGVIAVFAPRQMAADPVIAAIALAHHGAPREVRLAVVARGGPPGWPVSGTIPIRLVPRATAPDPFELELAGDPDPPIARIRAERARLAKLRTTQPDGTYVAIRIAPGATVEGLAKLLGALVYVDVAAVALVPRKP